MRVKTGFTRRKRHKKVLERAKGYYSANSRSYKIAVEKNDRALAYSYRDRKTKKRQMRSLWIIRIAAAAKLNSTSYSKLMGALKASSVDLDRRSLALMAVNDPKAFSTLVQSVSTKAMASSV